MSEPNQMEYIAARKTIRDCCCAVCWGHLILMPGTNGQWLAQCGRYGDQHAGTVSKAYAERRRAESRAELVEARQNLASILGIEDSRPADDQMHDMGFGER